MDITIKQKFLERWAKYFPGAELPIAFWYSDDEQAAPPSPVPAGWHCFIGKLARIRKGESRRFGLEHIGCEGGKRYSGFQTDLRPHFEYFLSCGIPDQLEGERYKKSPEIVRKLMQIAPTFAAPARYIVFKRWDKLEAADQPEVVIFFATPDVLSGLFTLSGFEEADPISVIAPFAAGCGSIILYPYIEQQKERPCAVLGMFDVSARPYVSDRVLSFAVPMRKFLRMIDNMDESFLITESWKKVQARLGKT